MSVITISRGTYSGGKKLAELVAERLGYACLERAAVVTRAAENRNIAFEKLTNALMEPPSVLERMRTEKTHYLAFMRAELAKSIQNGRVVYHGNAGHLLLGDVPRILKVRVVADMEYRIQNAMDRKKLSREEANRHIHDMDKKRARWTRFLYHVDWTDGSLYDMIINLRHMKLNTACDIVSNAATSQDFCFNEESHKAMADLLLATQVQAAIAEQGGVDDRSLVVQSSAGTVILGGTVRSLADADAVREIARNAPGVKQVESRMQVAGEFGAPTGM